MNVKSIIRQADQAGVELFLAGDRIGVRPKSKLNAGLRELIKTHRQEVVQYISAISTQSQLMRLAIQSGIFDHSVQLEEQEIATLVPPSDWNDTADCSREELQAWGAALALRQVPIHLPGQTRLVIDFLEFHTDGSVHFVNTRGVQTETFKLKRRQVEDLYPFDIEVV